MDTQQLIDNGYMTIPLPDAFYNLLIEIVKGMDEISMLSDNEKLMWSTDRHRTDGDPDENLVVRTDKKHDTKLFFHYRENSESQLKHIQKTPAQEKWLRDMNTMYIFLQLQAERIWKNLGIKLLMQLPYHLAKKYPLYSDMNVLRILKYINDPHKTFLARGHFDLSTLTIVLPDINSEGAPAPGLFTGSNPDKIYQHNTREALVFLGIKAMMASDPLWNPENYQTWTGEDSLLKPMSHGASKCSIVGNRFTIPFFAHTNMGLSLEETSSVAKRLYAKEYPHLIK